jgi:hypothetical protein
MKGLSSLGLFIFYKDKNKMTNLKKIIGRARELTFVSLLPYIKENSNSNFYIGNNNSRKYNPKTDSIILPNENPKYVFNEQGLINENELEKSVKSDSVLEWNFDTQKGIVEYKDTRNQKKKNKTFIYKIVGEEDSVQKKPSINFPQINEDEINDFVLRAVNPNKIIEIKPEVYSLNLEEKIEIKKDESKLQFSLGIGTNYKLGDKK